GDGGDQITKSSVSSIQAASIWATTPLNHRCQPHNGRAADEKYECLMALLQRLQQCQSTKGRDNTKSWNDEP
ncbi:hypothetical protein, partial [Aeromonas media]|uniref:hypothetical protein n=1 Tax=Aeromonas media TaxID=651 RepID=UPI003D209F89